MVSVTLRDTLVVAGFGAVLALFGSVFQLLLQSSLKRIDDRREYKRRWHDDVVDVIIDVREVRARVLRPLLYGHDSGDRTPIQQLSSSEAQSALERRILRIATGHPDKAIRETARKVYDKISVLVPIASLMIRTNRAFGGLPDNLLERFEEIRSLDAALHELEQRLHGERIESSDRRPSDEEIVELNEAEELAANVSTIFATNGPGSATKTGAPASDTM